MRLPMITAAAPIALLSALAAPVAAQGVSCGGVGDGAPWMGQTRAASDIATAGGALSLPDVQVAPGTRWAALFTLSAPMAVRVEAAPAGPTDDTIVELFDATGRLVVMDDDSGGGLASPGRARACAGRLLHRRDGICGCGRDRRPAGQPPRVCPR